MILAGLLCFSDHASFPPRCPPTRRLLPVFPHLFIEGPVYPGRCCGHWVTTGDTQARVALPGVDSPVGEMGKTCPEWPRRREQEAGT